MKLLVLISFLIFSMLSPVASSGMSPEDCCDEHMHSESVEVGFQTADHDHEDQSEDCCKTDGCFCHGPTNQTLFNPLVLAYFAGGQDLPPEQFHSPALVFLATRLRPPIS